MSISPIGSSPLTFYLPQLSPVSRVPRIEGGASDQLLKTANELETEEDATQYTRSLTIPGNSLMAGGNISVIV
ncbi:MAG: hypothetical protein KJ737_13995 [Proteobacteria bacterium]|nr:hypothetical protein [Pseudomonadota bacterium]